jgi:hypothetical protein
MNFITLVFSNPYKTSYQTVISELPAHQVMILLSSATNPSFQYHVVFVEKIESPELIEALRMRSWIKEVK